MLRENALLSSVSTQKRFPSPTYDSLESCKKYWEFGGFEPPSKKLGKNSVNKKLNRDQAQKKTRQIEKSLRNSPKVNKFWKIVSYQKILGIRGCRTLFKTNVNKKLNRGQKSRQTEASQNKVNKSWRNNVLPSSRSLSRCKNTLGKAANCFLSLSSCAK